MYFNVNCNVFCKLINVHLLVSELYIYQNARCNNKKKTFISTFKITYTFHLPATACCMDSLLDTVHSVFLLLVT